MSEDVQYYVLHKRIGYPVTLCDGDKYSYEYHCLDGHIVREYFGNADELPPTYNIVINDIVRGCDDFKYHLNITSATHNESSDIIISEDHICLTFYIDSDGVSFSTMVPKFDSRKLPRGYTTWIAYSEQFIDYCFNITDSCIRKVLRETL